MFMTPERGTFLKTVTIINLINLDQKFSPVTTAYSYLISMFKSGG